MLAGTTVEAPCVSGAAGAAAGAASMSAATARPAARCARCGMTLSPAPPRRVTLPHADLQRHLRVQRAVEAVRALRGELVLERVAGVGDVRRERLDALRPLGELDVVRVAAARRPAPRDR